MQYSKIRAENLLFLLNANMPKDERISLKRKTINSGLWKFDNERVQIYLRSFKYNEHPENIFDESLKNKGLNESYFSIVINQLCTDIKII